MLSFWNVVGIVLSLRITASLRLRIIFSHRGFALRSRRSRLVILLRAHRVAAFFAAAVRHIF